MLALALAVLPATALSATTGSLAGKVVDNAGVPVAAATVTASSGADVEHSTTDADGNYVFVNLVPGDYVVSVAKPGYMTIVSTAIAVNPGQQTVARLAIPRALTMITRTPGPRPPVLATLFYRINARTNPLFSTASTIGELLPFVPGVQAGGSRMSF
jgi:hypothetical protein